MLGYSKEDVEKMTDAIHDAKLFYILHSGDEYVSENPLVETLLETNSFLQGLIQEGHLD